MGWVDREIDIAIANVKNENENLVTRSRKFMLSEFIQKVDVPGKAICTLCDSFISYGRRGVALIVEHCNGKKHVGKVKARATNYKLSLSLLKLICNVNQKLNRKKLGQHVSRTNMHMTY